MEHQAGNQSAYHSSEMDPPKRQSRCAIYEVRLLVFHPRLSLDSGNLRIVHIMQHET
jgi:hypothetical protein